MKNLVFICLLTLTVSSYANAMGGQNFYTEGVSDPYSSWGFENDNTIRTPLGNITITIGDSGGVGGYGTGGSYGTGSYGSDDYGDSGGDNGGGSSGNSLGRDVGNLIKWIWNIPRPRRHQCPSNPTVSSPDMEYQNAKAKGLSEEVCLKKKEEMQGLIERKGKAKRGFGKNISNLLKGHGFDRSKQLSEELNGAVYYMMQKEPLLLDGLYGLLDTSPEILENSWCDTARIIEGARMTVEGVEGVKERLIRNCIGHEITRPVTPTKYDKAYGFMKDNGIPFTSVPGKFGEYANIRYATEINDGTYAKKTLDPSPFGQTFTWNDARPFLDISQKDTPSFNFSSTGIGHTGVGHTGVGHTGTGVELLNYFNQPDISANNVASNLLEDISSFHESFIETYKQGRDLNAEACQMYVDGVKSLNINGKAKGIITGLLQANAQINKVGDTATDLMVLPAETAEKIFKTYVQSRAETLIFFMKIKAEQDREYGLEYFMKSKTMSKEAFEEYVSKDIERRSDILGAAKEMADTIWNNGIDKNINLMLENGTRELVTAAFLSQIPTVVGGSDGVKFDFTSGTAIAKAVKTASGGTPSLQGKMVTSIVKEQAKKFGFTAVKNKDAKMLLKAFDTVRVSGVAAPKTQVSKTQESKKKEEDE